MGNLKSKLTVALALCAVVLSLVAVFTKPSGTPIVAQNQPPVTAGSQVKFGNFQTEPWICVGTSCTWYTAAPCGINGAISSSTIFSMQNPWQASSTAYVTLYGTQGATTTDILMATSTTPAPSGTAIATSSVDRRFFGVNNIATSSSFYISSGNTASMVFNSSNPFVNPYVNTAEVVVGPLEYLLAFSTSTFGGTRNGGTGASQVAVPASCTVEVTWVR